MNKEQLTKLAILAKQDPQVAQQLVRQANAISDDELEQVAGGEADADCFFVSCVFSTECIYDAVGGRHCKAVSEDTQNTR